ncbi:hypothetical protein Tco_1131111, partial [Tanacetum coccineum]
KPKRVKDYAYHKEKMMMCKQAEQGVPLRAEQADWLEDTDEEIDEQELEAHYSYMAKIQEVSPAESSSTDTPLEQVQNHDENDVFANVRRHSEQPESINDTYVLEKDDSNVIPDSSNICTNDNQSIQTIHMLAPKCATYNGRSTFANPKYLKIAQSEKPRLYEIPYDTSDPANRFCHNIGAWGRDQ